MIVIVWLKDNQINHNTPLLAPSLQTPLRDSYLARALQYSGALPPDALLAGDVLGDIDAKVYIKAKVVVLFDGLTLHGQTLGFDGRDLLNGHGFRKRSEQCQGVLSAKKDV